MYLKNELVDLHSRSASAADSRISELEKEIERQGNEKNLIAARLEEASQGPSKKPLIVSCYFHLIESQDSMYYALNLINCYAIL